MPPAVRRHHCAQSLCRAVKNTAVIPLTKNPSFRARRGIPLRSECLLSTQEHACRECFTRPSSLLNFPPDTFHFLRFLSFLARSPCKICVSPFHLYTVAPLPISFSQYHYILRHVAISFSFARPCPTNPNLLCASTPGSPRHH